MGYPEQDPEAQNDGSSKPDESSRHDQSSRDDEKFRPIKWAHQRFLHNLHVAEAPVNQDFMRAVFQSIHDIFPNGTLGEDEYLCLPKVLDVINKLGRAVELNFQGNDCQPYSGPLIPRREVVHALRELPFAVKRSRSESSAENVSRLASTPAFKRPRHDEDQGQTMAKGLASSTNAENPATSSKEHTAPRSSARDSSASTAVLSKGHDSKMSRSRESSIASANSRTRRRRNQRKNNRRRADNVYPDRAFPVRR